ncbi:ATP-dependent DNA helicase RecG [Paenibacillus sp. 1182]|uniref:ATP-dependent DNA helicase RecG n=1 Tax=Paenibacillus sp. 1182 TaxID=2806565 RepID=UPI001AE28C28|nr:ATP-dependent DNA helicase RecG [Paenibacillus sp. 1182]MBP1309276.1 ATP-dependent DNA helicase RecG [Paenibacillus sp. 1182]
MKLDALGISKAKLNQFESKGIMTVEELSRYFPRKYHDFRTITPIKQLKDGEVVAVVGTIKEIKPYEKKFIKVKVSDDSGRVLHVIWFHKPYVHKWLKEGETYIFCGKVQEDLKFHSKQMINPLYFSHEIKHLQRLVPVYPKIRGMAEEYLMNSIQSSLSIMSQQESLEPSVLATFGLMKSGKALKAIHQPENEDELERAKNRFMFDDLFEYSMQMQQYESLSSSMSPFLMNRFSVVTDFMNRLPFELTDGQREVLRSISLKAKLGHRVNALVQGDVGCGKTIVAILLMVVAAENGFQSALMAPTNVLARQHYEELAERLKDTPFKVAFLSGETKIREKKAILKGLDTGEIHMIVGTHSIIGKDVKIPNLALSIVDEEHRFGVVQRNQLREKARQGVHHISMSATPIPRTLALAMWGDQVDVYTIKTLPKGRKPVRTVLLTDEKRCFNGIEQQIEKGHQAYVVCPLIEDSESESMSEVDSVEKTSEKMKEHFSKNPKVKISLISGKMKPAEIAEEILRFTRNETNVLISTTIIEVGVNVPNATMMVVKNAERFGLAQLHQLRGRVGRGNFESFCVLLSEKEGNPKLQAMVETTDGFKIAKRDLELRGTGDFIGTKQSGDNKYVMLMMANMDLYLRVKEEVRAIHNDPRRLSFYKYLNVLSYEEGA